MSYSDDDEFGAITRYIDIEKQLAELEQLVPTLHSLLLEFQILLTEWMEKCYGKDIECSDVLATIKEQKTILHDFAYNHLKVVTSLSSLTDP